MILKIIQLISHSVKNNLPFFSLLRRRHKSAPSLAVNLNSYSAVPTAYAAANTNYPNHAKVLMFILYLCKIIRHIMVGA